MIMDMFWLLQMGSRLIFFTGASQFASISGHTTHRSYNISEGRNERSVRGRYVGKVMSFFVVVSFFFSTLEHLLLFIASTFIVVINAFIYVL